MRVVTAWLATRALFVQAVMAIASLFSGHWYLLDLLNHLVPLTAAAACVGLALAAMLRRPALAAALGLSLLWSGVRLMPGGYGADVAPDAAPVRVVVANVLTSNRDATRLLAWLDEQDPDVIGLVEVDSRWLADLAPLSERYPYQVLRPRNDNFGLAIYSKTLVVPVDPGVYADTPVLAVQTLDGLELVLVHPIPPMSEVAAERRDGQLRQFETVLSRPNTVVLGDLNATPWSRAFPAEIGYRTGTWPAWLPKHARIPIDHVLVGAGVGLDRLEVGPDIGSDHLPLVADLRHASAGRRSAQD